VTQELLKQYPISDNQIRNVAIDFAGMLDEGETLSGTPQVEQVGASSLELTAAAVNTAIISINGRQVPVGEAVQFRVDATGVQPPATVRVDVIVNTTSGQVVDTRIALLVS
jgi:hypothetical protein